MQATRKDSHDSLMFNASKPKMRRITHLRREISREEKRQQLLSQDLARDFCTIACGNGYLTVRKSKGEYSNGGKGEEEGLEKTRINH
jgi:hypothetical protein